MTDQQLAAYLQHMEMVSRWGMVVGGLYIASAVVLAIWLCAKLFRTPRP